DRDRAVRGRAQQLDQVMIRKSSFGFPIRSCSNKWPGEFRKTCGHRAIDLAPERHHEIGDPIEALPPPCIEFSRLVVARRQRIDLLVASHESQREPFLPLAAE